MSLKEHIELAYKLLPPPLSALPAKYHASISILLHSLSTGMITYYLAELAGFEDQKELASTLGITHDIHQKLVENGLATLRAAKNYIREKLDELGLKEYYRYVDDALEVDACGKGRPLRGLPKDLSLICHISDMVQGRLESLALLYWLREKVREVDKNLTVRFYSVTLPQPYARTYIMQRIYHNYIRNTEHLALASPWGLYIITYEDELPEVLEVNWDDLRVDPIIDYEKIVEIERRGESNTINKINISGNEAKNKHWSRFARIFYKIDSLSDDSPIYPILPISTASLFINIKFTDVEFKDLNSIETHICPLCGTLHLKEHSIVVNMYGKVAGVKVTTEKWNRRLPGNIIVRGWAGQWKYGYGLDPFCMLDAIAIRELGITEMSGIISVSISKPIPIQLLDWIAMRLRYRYEQKVEGIKPEHVEGVVIDYVAATASTSHRIPEPKTENLFSDGRRGGELTHLGYLIECGIYPIKYLQTLETSTPDRLLVTTHTFPLIDFSIISGEYREFIPWIATLLRIAGEKEKKDGLEILYTKPHHAPLKLLSLDKEIYLNISNLMTQVGVRT